MAQTAALATTVSGAARTRPTRVPGPGCPVLSPAAGTGAGPLVPAWLDDDTEVARRLGVRRGQNDAAVWPQLAVAAQLCARLARESHAPRHGHNGAARVLLIMTDVTPGWSEQPARGPDVKMTCRHIRLWSEVAALWRADLARCARLLAACLGEREPPSPDRLAATVAFVRCRITAYHAATGAWLDHT
jgi:hypothetical protein